MSGKDDELVRRVERLAGVGFCSTPSFSPDGSRIAFISDLSGTPQVWTCPVQGGWPQRVTAFPDQVTNAQWSPTDDLIAVEVAPGGGLNQQIYVVRSDGSALRRLTAGGADNNRLQRWSHDGTALYIASNRVDAASFDLYAVDIRTDTWRDVTRSGGIDTLTDLTNSQSAALVVRVVARGDSNVYLRDLQSGNETLLTPHEGQVISGSARFDKDGNVWLLSEEFGEHIGLYRITVHDRKAATIALVLQRHDAELESFEIDNARTRAVLVWNHAGRSEPELFDLATRKRSPGPKLDGDIVAGVRWSADGTRIVVVCAGAAAPVDIWTFAPGDATAYRLTESPHPGIELASLVRPRLESLKAHDGLDLSGWLYIPPGFKAPGPCVLSFHGGPEGQERPIFNRTYQALLANGIAVFAPNVRGSAGFGKTFVHLDDRGKRFDGIRDIQACADHVVRTGVADAKRIGITGASYGGYITMAGITEFPDLFAGAVCVCGIVNFLTFFQNTQPWMAAISKSEYGDPDTERELLEALSPINKIDRAKAPLLVLHGANDTNVPVVEAEQMVDELRKRNVTVDVVIFPDEGHGFTRTANRTRAAVETVRWFAKYL